MYYLEYDPFVLPFALGGLTLLVILLSKFFIWWDKLKPQDRITMRTGLRVGRTLSILKEVFLESLMHRRMFKQNPLLGYMHMTFAFGWFILIVIGNIEARVYSGIEFNLPYYPIFFKFFVHDKSIIPYSEGFTFMMDFFLLFVLSGLVLAMFKRVNAKLYGMKKPTHPEPIDRLALTALWFIFPLRLLAESFTSGVTHTGGFLTGTLGGFFAGFLPVDMLAYPAWWSYSIALGVFFVTLPFSRYMHIPSEVLLIYMRQLGFKPSKAHDFFSTVEVNSCPSCGVCVDHCQLKTSLSHDQIVPAYYFKKVKRNSEAAQANEECLLCGRCQEVCPVGIHVNDIRQQQRKNHYLDLKADFSYIKPIIPGQADYIYFAGCMTHLTPGIKKAMQQIFKKSGVNYLFIDRDGGICCGRPLQMSGQWESARQLIDLNTEMFHQTKAKTLITSCPICLKIFRDEYHLELEVLHHSQFIQRLLEDGRLHISISSDEVVFHDPCELGRGCGIYEEPRTVIRQLAGLLEVKHQAKDSLCCGGSLGSLSLEYSQRKLLRQDTLDHLLENSPDKLITGCPLCKKTFQPGSSVPVLDLAELVAMQLVEIGKPEEVASV
ncbi:MAG: (Fe-S)-binding protein [Bacteroidales bacterium]